MQTKQTLLSAVCILDDDDEIQNRQLLEHLNPKMNSRMIHKVVGLKSKFNSLESHTLYDEHAGNKGGVQRKFPLAVDQSIIAFWKKETTQDPNSYKYRTLRDENGEKYKQCYHYCHVKYYQMYLKWGC